MIMARNVALKNWPWHRQHLRPMWRRMYLLVFPVQLVTGFRGLWGNYPNFSHLSSLWKMTLRKLMWFLLLLWNPRDTQLVLRELQGQCHVFPRTRSIKSPRFFRLSKQEVVPLLLPKIHPEEMAWRVRAPTHMFCLLLFLACSGWPIGNTIES